MCLRRRTTLTLQKPAGGYSTPKIEPIEASESGDHSSAYVRPPSASKVSPPMKLANFNLFDTMAAAGMYDSTVNTPATSSASSTTQNSASLAAAYAAASSNGTHKTHQLHHPIQNGHPHHGQHLYASHGDYGSSPVTAPNGYWPYSTQPYFNSTPRQYMVPQTPPTSVSDTCSSPSRQELSYHTHGPYPHMQKMVGNYPTNYEFYQQHNAKYC